MIHTIPASKCEKWKISLGHKIGLGRIKKIGWLSPTGWMRNWPIISFFLEDKILIESVEWTSMTSVPDLVLIISLLCVTRWSKWQQYRSQSVLCMYLSSAALWLSEPSNTDQNSIHIYLLSTQSSQ